MPVPTPPTARSRPGLDGRVPRMTLLIILATSAGCQAPLPTPPEVSDDVAAGPATEPATYPPLTGSGRIYAYSASLHHQVSPYTALSRFVLYDDASFALQMYIPPWGAGEYRGTYTEVGSDVAFSWEGWSVLGPWGATATLVGDLLTVRYNWVMLVNDFEDAVYVLGGR